MQLSRILNSRLAYLPIILAVSFLWRASSFALPREASLSGEILLREVQFSLWKEGTSQQSKDRFDQLSREVLQLKEYYSKLSERTEEWNKLPFIASIKENHRNLNSLKLSVKKKHDQLVFTQKNLNRNLEIKSLELKKELPNLDLVRELEDRNVELKKQITTLESEIAKLFQEKSLLDQEITEQERNPLWQDLQRLEELKRVNIEASTRTFNELATIADLYSPAPSQVVVHIADDNTASVSIHDWILAEGEKSMNCTSKPSVESTCIIENVRYLNHTQSLEFEIRVLKDDLIHTKETFSFELKKAQPGESSKALYFFGSMRNSKVDLSGKTINRYGSVYLATSFK